MNKVGEEVIMDGEWFDVVGREVVNGRVYLTLRDDDGYEREVRPSMLDKD
jgi:hypothetical protein